MRILSSWPDVARRAVLYGLIGGLVFIGMNALTWVAFLTYKNHMRLTLSEAANPAGLLPEKAAYYLDHRGDYNALFLGDSRTLCGMHPDLIDPVWGRRSYNLSHWAAWFPTQYGLIMDIAPHIPKDTVVVWSIGHQNFAGSPMPAVYPPRWPRIIPMMMKGVDLPQLVSAQLAFTPPLALVGRNEQFFDRVTHTMDTVIWRKPLQTSSSDVSAREPAVVPAATRLEETGAHPLTAYAEPWHDDDGNIASIAQYKTNGAMLRTELTPSFYRGKQDEDRAAGNVATVTGFTYEDAQMALFRDVLDRFRAQGLNVIIAELEEAPYRYRDEADRIGFRRWMRTVIKPIVEEYGFKYVHPDEANLKDADYFDYNHMNASGVRKHNAVLARKLKDAAR